MAISMPCRLHFWRTTPSEDEIRTAIAGNICRCTGYVQIVESIDMAANKNEKMRG